MYLCIIHIYFTTRICSFECKIAAFELRQMRLCVLLFTREAHTNPDVTKYLPLHMVAMDLISITLANFLVLSMTLAYELAAVVAAAVATAVVAVAAVAESIGLARMMFADSMCSWRHHLAISHHYGIRPPIQLFREECNCHPYPIHDSQKNGAANI